MKQCPACSAEYEDDVKFCAKDGRSLVAKISSRTRLCPHCANSIPEDSASCSYCKADLSSQPAPQWPVRDEVQVEGEPQGKSRKIPILSKFILAAGIIMFALGVYMIGGEKERSDAQLVLHEKVIELREKEQKIKSLETELARIRQELSNDGGQLTELKVKLDENQKELSKTQQRLSAANRELQRLAARREAPVANAAGPRQQAASATTYRRPPAEPGTYEAIRSTSVYESPSGSARIITRITKGTRINVVRSVGDWLEVRSNRGNPPGFILWNDAMLVVRAN